MAVLNILRGLNGERAGHRIDAAANGAFAAADRLRILDEYEQAGIGWIWATDADGCLCYLSQSGSDELGMPLAGLLGQPLHALFETDPDNPDERSDRPLNFQLNARSKIHDLTVRVAAGRSAGQGRETWWAISGHPQFSAGGKFEGYRGSAKDVTV